MPFLYRPHRHREPVIGAPALALEQVCVLHPRDKQIALDQVSFEIAPAQRVALVGANGAGKSTLLKTIVGLMRIESGKVSIYGNPIGLCYHRVAYLPQRGEIDWRFPVSLERLVLAGRYVHLGWFGTPNAEDRAICQTVIAQLGLKALTQRQISQLSGGQQQRALLARAIVQGADLLLLDEPFNAVDSETREIIWNVLDQLQQQGKTVVVATHDTAQLAQQFDRVLEMSDGKVLTLRQM
ncbi:MAG TPA: ABC transporter ATP-binding protein [Anaerolineales bacterium]|nr:ABC transporter ATP-binding protein [Anaerolineales bacterium]